MAKHPTSSRVHREGHGPDDAFVSTVKRSYDWGRENSRALIIALVLVVVVGGAAVWFAAQQRRMESQAAQRFNQVQQTLASGNVQLAIRDLEGYLDRFGETETASQARLILAGLLIDQERTDEALEALGDLPDDLEQPFGLAAARLEAAAHEELGNLEEAVQTYERIADRARFPYQRREALADAARVRFQNGDADRAAQLYQQVVDSFDADEPGRGYYQMWLAEARAQAAHGPGTTPTTPDTSSETSGAPEDAGDADNG